jgi:hypothetical protein
MESEEIGKLEIKKNLTKNKAVIYDEMLDYQTGYSAIYLTSVYHDNVDELKNILKDEYSKINTTGKISLNEYKNVENLDNFENDFNNLRLINEDLSNSIKVEKNKNKLFLYSIGITIFTIYIQLTFCFSLLFESYYNKILIITDSNLIYLRLVLFITFSLKFWIGYSNGRKKLNHSLYQNYLYRTINKNIISGLFGLIQIVINFLIYFTFIQILIRENNLLESIFTFVCFIIIINLEKWIGNYFIFTNGNLLNYSRNNFIQIWCVDKEIIEKQNYFEYFEDGLCLLLFLLCFIPLYKSIKI